MNTVAVSACAGCLALGVTQVEQTWRQAVVAMSACVVMPEARAVEVGRG